MVENKLIGAVKSKRSVVNRDNTGRKGVKPGLTRRKRVTFSYQGSPGSRVYLAGCFNNWDAACQPLDSENNDGVYGVTLLLPRGCYEYKFIVDGQWRSDPVCSSRAPDGHGGENSMLVVS